MLWEGDRSAIRAVGEVAKYLSNDSEAMYFYNRSKNYHYVWNEDHQLMCPRKVQVDTLVVLMIRTLTVGY